MKEEPEKWSLFDIVGIYSSRVKTTLKAIKTPMETTHCFLTSLDMRHLCLLSSFGHLVENLAFFKSSESALLSRLAK